MGYSFGVASQKYYIVLPHLASIPLASFRFRFSILIRSRHQNRKIPVGWNYWIPTGLGIIRFEPMTSTTSRWHSTAELYPLSINKTDSYGYENNGIWFNCQLPLLEIGWITDLSNSTSFHKTVRFSRSK